MSCPPRGPPGPSVASVPMGCDNSGDRRRPWAPTGRTPGPGGPVVRVPPWARCIVWSSSAPALRGLSAARTLVGEPVEVTIVDRGISTPSSPCSTKWPPPASSPGTWPTRSGPSSGGPTMSTFRFATVTGADWDRRQVILDGGRARSPSTRSSWPAGPRPSSSGSPGPPSSASPSTPSPTPGASATTCCAGSSRPTPIRRWSPRVPLNFVVVGGGPTGVEVAGALAELLDVAVRHDGFRFPRGSARIILVDGLDRLLTPFKPSAVGLHRPDPRGPGDRAAAGPHGAIGHQHLRRARQGRPDPDPDGGLGRRRHRGGHRRLTPGRAGRRQRSPGGRSRPHAGRPTGRLRRRRRRRRAVGTGVGRSREDLPPARPGGHPVGRPRRPPDRQPDRRSSHAAVPLQGQGHHGHHRAAGGHHRVPQRRWWSRERSGWLVVAGPAPRLPGRIPEQDHRAGQLVVAVPVVGIGTPGHRGRRPRAERGGCRTRTATRRPVRLRADRRRGSGVR